MVLFHRGVGRDSAKIGGVTVGAHGCTSSGSDCLPQAGVVPAHLADVEHEAVFRRRSSLEKALDVLFGLLPPVVALYPADHEGGDGLANSRRPSGKLPRG